MHVLRILIWDLLQMSLLERLTLEIVKDRIPLGNPEVPELSRGKSCSLVNSALPNVVKAFSVPHQMAASGLLLKYVRNATR